MPDQKPKPAPLETDPGTQMDDNIDDLGRKPGGSTQEQPTEGKPVAKGRTPPSKAVDDEDPAYIPMTERGPDGRAHKTAKTEAEETRPRADEDTPKNPSIMPTNPD